MNEKDMKPARPGDRERAHLGSGPVRVTWLGSDRCGRQAPVVTSAVRDPRLILAAVLVVLASASGCAGQPEQHAARPSVSAASAGPQTRTPAPAPARTAAIGGDGTYRTGERQVTFTEPARTGPAGQHLSQRTLVTQIRYPRARGPGGPFPLLLFAPGFRQCPGAYSDLLQAWASAGYVVAAVTFPRTNCHLGPEAYEADLVNQPHDMSYVMTRLLALSTRPGGPFSGLLDPHAVGAAGQSDGGDTVAALAASTCCTDRLRRPWPSCPGPSGRRCRAGTSPAGHRRCCSHRAPPIRSTRRG